MSKFNENIHKLETLLKDENNIKTEELLEVLKYLSYNVFEKRDTFYNLKSINQIFKLIKLNKNETNENEMKIIESCTYILNVLSVEKRFRSEIKINNMIMILK
jgi:hypothetical protein